jgi:hypothetical protein
MVAPLFGFLLRAKKSFRHSLPGDDEAAAAVESKPLRFFFPMGGRKALALGPREFAARNKKKGVF